MKVGFTCGAFDLCHAGHAAMLEEAKSVCDYLIVGVQTDPSVDRPNVKNKPIQALEERIRMVQAIKYADRVIVYDTEEDLYDLLKNVLKVDIRIIGADWKGKQYTGYDLPIQMFFNTRNHTYSTTELRRRVYEAEKKKIEESSVHK